MSSQQFQETYESIYTTGIKLLQYLQEMRAGQLSEGNNAQSLQTIEAEITTALKALQEQKYQVAVIAAMKAGKSTFLNALIGADVLASETEACTVCRTDIYPLPPDGVPKLLEYRQGQRKPLVVAQGSAAAIQKQFLQRTHDIRTTANKEGTLRFQLEHPIEAIHDYSSLKGLTLVDTPGPNEWQSEDLNFVSLKQTALEALRTCDAILFILDYCSFKDNTNSELLQELIEQRQEVLQHNTGKIYFILNKIDRKTEDDRPIDEVISDLRQMLVDFGIPNPNIYPTSAWQGLLAKLIQQETATSSHLKNFKNFFSGRYARENEEGDLIAPAPKKIAPQALEDSLIKKVEALVIQNVIGNSGWNLLHDVLAKLDKAAKAIEDSINLRINGWEMELQPLREKIEDYANVARGAIGQVKGVKALVEQQEKKLISQFRDEITEFAEKAKQTIQEEIDLFVQSWLSESTELEPSLPDELNEEESLPKLDVPQRLKESLTKIFANVLSRSESPYEIRCETEEEAQAIKEDINGVCAVLIKNWWSNTQDKLSRDGSEIRQELVAEIHNNIQMISDDLSKHIGESLDIALNINPIQSLGFEFQGIDSQVQYYTETFTKLTTEKRKGFCRDYEVDIPVEEQLSYYGIDLRKTTESIKTEIDNQTLGSLAIVEKAIKKQVSEDFRNAERQIYDYIERFQEEFERLLKERANKEAKADRIVAILEFQRDELHEYMGELVTLKEVLNTWKPGL
ncbi:dynamin family protein [Lusitaniella coriacea LEGE 07157]|uniref:Dynamin family protein n=1 Tax=Lusitaniella coriacea LEGE 07157 TaxID=945747 RepID=A0A8J7JBT3_9CYAN|nr:dynamin family protein [Lusitaniella coriacea]MBE9117160.1 dynamin family protein [Lusitaniella coriacea LEGE 07157]